MGQDNGNGEYNFLMQGDLNGSEDLELAVYTGNNEGDVDIRSECVDVWMCGCIGRCICEVR